MKMISALLMLALCAAAPAQQTDSVSIGPSYNPTFTGSENVFIGKCAGWSTQHVSRDILIGDYTSLPTHDTDNFVNIDGKICAWRTTGERVPCPPPEPECYPAKGAPNP